MNRAYEESPSNDYITIEETGETRFEHQLKACIEKVVIPFAIVLLMVLLTLTTVATPSYQTQQVHFHKLTATGIIGDKLRIPYSDIPNAFALPLRSPSKLEPNYIELPPINLWYHAKIKSGPNNFWYNFAGSTHYRIHGLASFRNVSISSTHHSGIVRIADTIDLSKDQAISDSILGLQVNPMHYNCNLSLGNSAILEKYAVHNADIILKSSLGEPCIDFTLPPSPIYVLSFKFKSVLGNGAICFYTGETCTDYISLSRTRNWHKLTEIINPSNFRSLFLFLYGVPANTGPVYVQFKNLTLYTTKYFNLPILLYESIGNTD